MGITSQDEGKMFGVLVVRDSLGNVGYLAAFSGRLNDSYTHPHFVPPVFDLYGEDGTFVSGESEINALNAEIKMLEQSDDMQVSTARLSELMDQSRQEIEESQARNREAKRRRKLQRDQHSDGNSQAELELLNRESKRDAYTLKQLKKYWNQRIEKARRDHSEIQMKIDDLSARRRSKSKTLQTYLFRQFDFLNSRKELRNLHDLFSETAFKIPPSGAGECAGPKLLQYAFQQDYQPLVLAEFWWGLPPSGELKRHGYFYPACRGKCEPILKHMLQGMSVEENPLLATSESRLEISILFEDEFLAVISKPGGLLSAPGKELRDSVFSRMRDRYPEANGPLVVHRLDMATSGIMLIAKSFETYKKLQAQFIDRTVHKEYTAILEGTPPCDRGIIRLPLRTDILDRPRQMVCFEHGKEAITEWELIQAEDGRSKIRFFPKTGRSHQLRVHAAHKDGLNAPIEGDDLYGTPSGRLHLHASAIRFSHPETGKQMLVEDEVPFSLKTH